MSVKFTRNEVLEVNVSSRRYSSAMEAGEVRNICSIFRYVLRSGSGGGGGGGGVGGREREREREIYVTIDIHMYILIQGH